MPATRKNTLQKKFCRCIKKVGKTIKLRPGQKKTASAKESAAIGTCVKAVLQTRGKTLKRFSCGVRGKKKFLSTQKPLKGGFISPYQSTDPTASKILPGLQGNPYENAVKGTLQL